MLYKEDIEEILLEKYEEQVLTIYYKGFKGKGINGVYENYISIRNLDDDCNIVSNIEYSDGEAFQTRMINLELKNNYIKASFQKYRRTKYNKEFKLISIYSTIVPYDSIQSIEIK